MASAADDKITGLRRALDGWYREQARDLPWRRTRDPYAIWISEVMLQQTRVDTVLPRYGRWLDRFPSVEALAEAPLDDVLAEWAGLGYYARARNLHAAACEVVARYGGEIPDDPAAVRALPGVGPYTAGAILSLAFGRPEPVLDGNVIRVLTRLFVVSGDPQKSTIQKQLWKIAHDMVYAGNAAVLNQALMELGATVCTLRTPACTSCPVDEYCEALRHGAVSEYPTRSKAQAIPTIRTVVVALMREGGQVLLVRRPPRGLWGGLYELPSGEPANGESLAQAAERIARQGVGLAPTQLVPLEPFTHVLTHRRILIHGFRSFIEQSNSLRLSGYDAALWLVPDEARQRGISRATARLLEALRPAVAEPQPASPPRRRGPGKPKKEDPYP